MYFLAELGELAFGSRLRAISDEIMQDGGEIYATIGEAFNPRWFPVFALLAQRGPSAIVEMANALHITHPAVNQTVNELEKHGLVKSTKDAKDKRKRNVELTPKGKAMAKRLEPAWQTIRHTIREMLAETGVEVLEVLARVEDALDKQRFVDRFRDRYRQTLLDSVEIVPYTPELREAFRTISYGWIGQYFTIEPIDREIIDHPEEMILAPGGCVLFARDKGTGEIYGTCAVMKHGDTYELTKMGVLPSARGRQVGKKLGLAAIEWARQSGLPELMLETNSSLTPAINLYRRLGFVTVPFDTPSDYVRADVRMVLTLKNDPRPETTGVSKSLVVAS